MPQARRTQAERNAGEGTFLVFSDGECIPLDGPMRVERLRGSFYLLGERRWERWDRAEAAQRRLLDQAAQLDPNGIAEEVLEALACDAVDPIFG